MDIAVFILAGGSGIRLWPLSRQNAPKQFLPLLPDGISFFQKTLERAKRITDISHIFVLTQNKYLDFIKKQAPEIREENIIPESEKRNTAPSIAYASTVVQRRFGDTLSVIMPSDHFIGPEDAFIDTLLYAVKKAESNHSLITIGIEPSRPATCYGYIKCPDRKKASDDSFLKAERFKEKPDLATAKAFLDSGDYLWNSGIFIWKTSVFLNELKNYQPAICTIIEKMCKANDIESKNTLYAQMPSVSVDTAILEKSENIYVCPASFSWDDIGSWFALELLGENDKNGNISIGTSIFSDSKNCTSVSRDSLTVCIGAQDLYIINTGSCVLVFPKDKADSTEKIIALLEENGFYNLL